MQNYPVSAKYALVIGSVAIDKVATPDGQSGKVLGGAASYASIACSYFAPTRMVGIVGGDFPEAHLQRYRSHGIDLDGLTIDKSGKTFFWSGKYRENFEGRDSLETHLNVFEKFSPTLPTSYRSTPYVMLGAIMPALQLQVLDQLLRKPRKPFIIADTFDLWINTAAADLAKVMKKVDLLVINEDEARLLTGERNVVPAGAALRKMGPKAVIIKKGSNGAALFHAAGYFAIPAYPIDQVVDPTGAGDSFAGAITGYLASINRSDFSALKRALAYATAVASLTVESFSVDRLSDAGRRTVDTRYRTMINITRF